MIGTPAQLHAASAVDTVAVADANLTLSSKLKSLGVILDSRLSFDAHVAVVCKTCNYHIYLFSFCLKQQTNTFKKIIFSIGILSIPLACFYLLVLCSYGP